MWLCTSAGFISAVNDRDKPGWLIVRARRKGILAELFPKAKIVKREASDYRYRIFVSKKELAKVVSDYILGISYPNFKDSVKDRELHRLYCDFWELHRDYQEAERE